MRRMIAMAAAAVLVGATTLASTPAFAAPATAALVAAPGPLQPVQFYGAGPPHWGDDGWGRRRQWREWRQHRDEARIAEAARREAWRIEQEREQRRAWRRATRGQHGYGYGPNPAYGHGPFRGW